MSTTDAGGTPDFADALAARLHPYPFTISRLTESQRKTDGTRTETARKIREEFQQQTAALQKENAELRKDKERLDRIQDHGMPRSVLFDRSEGWIYDNADETEHCEIRFVIDAEIRAAQQSSTPLTGNGGGA